MGRVGSLAERTADQLIRLIKPRLRHIQYGPELTAGFVAESGLDLERP